MESLKQKESSDTACQTVELRKITSVAEQSRFKKYLSRESFTVTNTLARIKNISKRKNTQEETHEISTTSLPSLCFSLFILPFAFGYNFIVACLRTIIQYLVRHPIHAAFNVLVFSLLWLAVVTGSQIHEQMIVSKISDNTVDQIINASRFTRSFKSPEVATSTTREYLNAGAPEWAQREGVKAILFQARKEGLSIEHQAVLLATAEVESGFNPMAKASTTSACGLFQFVKRTGMSFGLEQKDCMSPWLNAKAGVAHYVKNYNKRVKSKVKDLIGAERVFGTYKLSYYMHHDGPNYSYPSTDVKATILSGTQFLLKTHEILRRENQSKTEVPTFSRQFAGNLMDTFHTVRGFFGDFGSSIAHADEKIESSVVPSI